MPLAADALQPFIVGELISIAGNMPPMTLADVITAPTAGYDLNVVNNTRTLTLDFREPTFISMALASDCGRFSCASFQTVANVANEMVERDNFAWSLVKLYYSAFYAGHAIIRILGEGCSFFYKRHADHLTMVRNALGIAPAFRIEKGLYHCVLNGNATAIAFVQAQGSVGGAHEAFWLIFGAKIKSVSQAVLKGGLTRLDAQAVFGQLDGLLQIIGRRSGYSWLSGVRNDLQYRLHYDAWYPAKARPQYRQALGRLAGGWTRDPMRIDLKGQKWGLLEDYVASCTFIISLCREILWRIAESSSKGARSFVRIGPVAFLNDIGVVK